MQFTLVSVFWFAETGLVVWFRYTQLPADLFASRIARKQRLATMPYTKAIVGEAGQAFAIIGNLR